MAYQVSPGERDVRAKIVKALIAARVAGESAASGPDGGSANHDCCVVWFEGRRPATVEPMLQAAGFQVTRMHAGHWKGGYQLHVKGCGQGASMTRAAEAIRESLKTTSALLTTAIYYQTD